MLFSISQPGWCAISVAASVFFIGAMLLMHVGLKLPDDTRAALAEHRRRNRWKIYFLAPVMLAIELATNLLDADRASDVLFLYSVALAALPVALFPVRGRMFRDYVAMQRNPGVKIKLDRLMMAWVCGVLFVAVVASVLALTVPSPYSG